MNIYWIIVILTIVLGVPLCKNAKGEKIYIAMMTILHVCVSGLRYMLMTGDLQKYAARFYLSTRFDWMSREIYNQGRNFGFSWLLKFFAETTYDFQDFLFFISAVVGVALAIVIYKYSPKPWLSYLVWNCMGFYIFGFSAIKQSLAMAFIFLSIIFIFESKPIPFIVMVLLAGAMHVPAFIFLPAYWICKFKINYKSISLYFIGIVIIFIFKNKIVQIMSKTYYEEASFTDSGSMIGGRFIVIVFILICAYVLRSFTEERFKPLFNIIAVAAALQLFSAYDNVFTRLADYYFQFSVLFIPLMFYSKTVDKNSDGKIVVSASINNDSKTIFYAVIVLIIVLIWWYYRTCLGGVIDIDADNYLNYRSKWDVDESLVRQAINGVLNAN